MPQTNGQRMRTELTTDPEPVVGVYSSSVV